MPAGIWKIKRRLGDVQGLEGPRARHHVVVNVVVRRQNGAQLHRAVRRDGPLHARQSKFAPAQDGV